MIDTSSPITFIKDSLRELDLLNKGSSSRPPRRYNTLSNHEDVGIAKTLTRIELCLDEKFTVNFNIYIILRNNTFEHDVVIGRDFLENKLTLAFGLNSDTVNDVNDRKKVPSRDIYAMSDNKKLED